MTGMVAMGSGGHFEAEIYMDDIQMTSKRLRCNSLQFVELEDDMNCLSNPFRNPASFFSGGSVWLVQTTALIAFLAAGLQECLFFNQRDKATV